MKKYAVNFQFYNDNGEWHDDELNNNGEGFTREEANSIAQQISDRENTRDVEIIELRRHEMTSEKKMELFEAVLEIERLANVKTYDGVDYYEQSEGAFKMLKILGLHHEYIKWSFGK